MPSQKALKARLCALAIALVASAAASAGEHLDVVTIGQLPLWHGDPTTLTLISGLHTHSSNDGVQPDVRYGATVKDRLLYPDYTLTALPAKAIPNGWHLGFGSSDTDCKRATFKFSSDVDGSSRSLEVVRNRTDGLLDRMLDHVLPCLGGSATIYYGVMASDNVLAVMTADPAYRFFDTATGQVSPLVILTSRNDATNLLVTPEGELLIEAQPEVVLPGQEPHPLPEWGIRVVSWKGISFTGGYSSATEKRVDDLNHLSSLEGKRQHEEYLLRASQPASTSSR
jgi:hypothetical protein